tara:strand:- start:255 stop:446 length:192 start_codon:yes stop_codon:yes gene_type:complete
MPVTIPAALAAKFVSNSSLKTRIRVLQTSYKAQVSGMTIFVASNFDKGVVIKFVKTLSVFPII